MTRAFIVESWAALEVARAQDAGADALWLTTSPYIMERLSMEKTYFRNLEEALDHRVGGALAKAGYDFTFALSDLLNRECSWRENLDLRLALAFGINNCFFPVFYKALLMQTALETENGLSLICVGEAAPARGRGLCLLYGRFDNLFALLASRIYLDGVRILPHRDDREMLESKERLIFQRRMSVWEKGLSLLNNTPGSFFAKAYGQLRRRKIYPFAHLALWPRPQAPHIYIYNNCELIDEILLGLLLRGVRIGRVGRLPVCADADKPLPEVVDGLTQKYLSDLCGQALNGRGMAFGPWFQAAASIVAERVLNALHNLKTGLPALRKEFDRILKPLHARGIILTNGLTAPEELLFYSHCREQGRKVAAFEHGLVYGLSEWDSWCARHAGMLAADIGVYHTAAAAACIKPYATGQKQIVAGLPRITFRPILPALQRRIARKWLGIGRREHVVFYLAGVERNNFIYGPNMENDFLQHRRIFDAVRVLRQDFPASRIIVKLYPSSRYANQHTYRELSAVERVTVIRDMDFQFIRCAADMIYLHSAQSTLGWCLGSGATVHYLEPEQAPVRFNGSEAGSMAVPGIRRVLTLDMKQFASAFKPDRKFYEELFA